MTLDYGFKQVRKYLKFESFREIANDFGRKEEVSNEDLVSEC